MVGKARVIAEALPLLFVELQVLRSGIVIGPFSGTVMDGGHVPIVPRGNEIALGFGGTGLGLAPFGGAFESGADIGHLLHAGADRGEIGIGFDAAWRGKIDRARLIPVNSVGANDVINGPALL